MYCQKCGAPINGKYCSNCGSSNKQSTLGETIGSIICMLVSTLFFPPIIGGIGIYLGYRVYKLEKIKGIILMIASTLCMLFGMFLGFLTTLLF